MDARPDALHVDAQGRLLRSQRHRNEGGDDQRGKLHHETGRGRSKIMRLPGLAA